MNTNRDNLKAIVQGAYDLQKLRIMAGNRIVGNFKSKLGQEPSHKEDEIDAEGKKILSNLRESYRRLTDGVATFPRQSTFKGDELISSYTELCLISEYLDLEEAEAKHFRRLGNVLKEFQVYNHFLVNVKGVGPAMAGVIISRLDPHKAKYASSFWKYSGLDVAGDGKGRSRKESHLVDREYTTKEGKQATRRGITYDPFLKTKLIGVLGGSFLKAGDNTYSRVYRAYLHRLENHAVYGIANDEHRIAEQKTDGKKYSPKLHRHNMAIRYAVKRFLADLWREWRTLEGLPVTPEYSEAKLGYRHGKAA